MDNVSCKLFAILWDNTTVEILSVCFADCSEIYVSFSDDDVEDVSDVETTEQVPQESQGAGIVIDKSKDKNNLFFKRPYKVYIPRSFL